MGRKEIKPGQENGSLKANVTFSMFPPSSWLAVENNILVDHSQTQELGFCLVFYYQVNKYYGTDKVVHK